MHTTPLASLRFTLLGALGVTFGGCGSVVEVTDGDPTGSGGGTTGVGPTSGSGAGGSGANCEGATVVKSADGTDSGFRRCPDGTLHRAFAATCETSAPGCDGTEDFKDCASDAECTAAPNGRCASSTYSDFGGESSYCGCVYPCASDADCSAGLACVCNGVVATGTQWATCLPAGCATGDDCESGECGISTFDDGCSQMAQLACRAETDACRLDAECGPDRTCATAYGDTTWDCWGYNCAIGRPVLVDGVAQTAVVTERSDWRNESLRPDVEGMAPALRAALSAQWQEIAALEHASIGSFARFSLQLLAIGAPPELLAEAQRAALEEIEHARIAYAVASEYAGQRLGPSTLDAASAPISVELAEVLVSLVAEACVGETVGVAEASYLASVVADPVIARVHARIAEEETRHAELAFRALRFGMAKADLPTRRRVIAAFDQACEAMGRGALGPDGIVSREHGLLGRTELVGLRRQAVREVVAPCARALFAELDAELGPHLMT